MITHDQQSDFDDHASFRHRPETLSYQLAAVRQVVRRSPGIKRSHHAYVITTHRPFHSLTPTRSEKLSPEKFEKRGDDESAPALSPIRDDSSRRGISKRRRVLLFQRHSPPSAFIPHSSPFERPGKMSSSWRAFKRSHAICQKHAPHGSHAPAIPITFQIASRESTWAASNLVAII